MRQLWEEFKSFALKGNMIDLAVAVIIGGAFGAVVNSLVKNILMPIITYLPGLPDGYRTWSIGRIEVGAFLSEIINFLIVAGAIFILIKKVLGAISRKPPPAEPTTRECPFCLSTIPIKATRCAHCTSEVPASAVR